MNMKTAVITGASRGIGYACALKLAGMGYNIAVNCHKNSCLLDKLEEETRKYNIKCLKHTGDIGIYENASGFFNSIENQLGVPDILVNNAGISYIGLLQDMTPEEWNYIIQVNLTSVFNCSKLVIPMMLKRKSGKIINISSVWGCTGASAEVAYSATKGGVNAFTKALAKELAPSNIQVNAIACGIIDTEMNSLFSGEEIEAIKEEIPACRLGTPGETAGLVCQLAESSSYLTGQVIKLDGGWI